MVGIYKITSPSGKIYIGQSWDIDKRRKAYYNLKCKGQQKLYNSFRKYKWSNHVFEIVHMLPNDVDQSTLDAYEIFYWEMYISSNHQMLNIANPGRGGKGTKHSQEVKDKISKVQKEHYKNSTRSVNHHNRAIQQFELDGTFVRDWDSIKEASDFFNVNLSFINNCLRKDNRKSSLGFVWKYK